jgi:hypothetical protein
LNQCYAIMEEHDHASTALVALASNYLLIAMVLV